MADAILQLDCQKWQQEFYVQNCKSFSPSLNAQISCLKQMIDGLSKFTGFSYQAISG